METHAQKKIIVIIIIIIIIIPITKQPLVDCRGFRITLRHTKLGRTPLDE